MFQHWVKPALMPKAHVLVDKEASRADANEPGNFRFAEDGLALVALWRDGGLEDRFLARIVLAAYLEDYGCAIALGNAVGKIRPGGHGNPVHAEHEIALHKACPCCRSSLLDIANCGKKGCDTPAQGHHDAQKECQNDVGHRACQDNQKALPGRAQAEALFLCETVRQFRVMAFPHQGHVAAKGDKGEGVFGFADLLFQYLGPKTQGKCGNTHAQGPGYGKMAEFVKEDESAKDYDYG